MFLFLSALSFIITILLDLADLFLRMLNELLMILQSSNRQCEVSPFKLYLLSPRTIWHWIRKYLEFGFGKLMCGFPVYGSEFGRQLLRGVVAGLGFSSGC
ncbi:hypothetical protein NC653_038263 [Populus alba x Populus x berolinensis]|uniref:Uncharacterized protein n=1 Tax=Populus alba x Populus x berolinensis TaxID=444605 RepID=A0AAD6LG89_9ROSI|nr:hypothetical protein NC653_038263 [Populus alba x Populus x berolinensis]